MSVHGDQSKRARFHIEGSKVAVHCREHAEDGMVNLIGRCCTREGYSKQPRSCLDGSQATTNCRSDAVYGLTNVNRRYPQEGCNIQVKSDVEGSKEALYGRQHSGNSCCSDIQQALRSRCIGQRRSPCWPTQTRSRSSIFHLLALRPSRA